MTVVNQEKTDGVLKLTLKVDGEVYTTALEKARRKVSARMNVPGFRKGKTPVKIIEAMYGKGVFTEEAVNATYYDAYREAITGTGMLPVSQPDIDITELSEDGYVFVAAVPVYPEVTLKEYKGLECKREPRPVTDEDVQEKLEGYRERNARVAEKDGAAEQGNTLDIDYEGFIDGVAFEGGTAKGQELTIGSGRFIPGFEEQLTGATAGSEHEVKVTFPEEYHAEELQGREAIFKVKVNGVREKLLPDLDDELAKDVSEFNTLEELKADLRGKIEHEREHEADTQFENALFDKILEGFEAEIPNIMVERGIDSIAGNFLERLQARGLNAEEYYKVMGMDEESMRQSMRPQAERNIKCELALEKIIELEKLEVSEDELEAELERISKEYSVDIERVRAEMSLDGLRSGMLKEKALKLIKDSVQV